MLQDAGTFSFGKIETTWLVVDGSGQQSYDSDSIVSHYEPDEMLLPADLELAKQQIIEVKKE
ncbi:MAG: hypothetical protein HC780_01380, partial [Leptolyngbyaceae cyanobacterium CSU_1_3]|nr:hypothetical protein [Leptolyngbyaceae cyanobacterium CSU_1_3]